MALKLKWKNPNTGATTTELYRGDTQDVSLTTPLVTLTGGETEWIDNSALFGQTYYYVWAVNTANDRIVSRPQKIEVTDRKGPGTNVMQYGNERYGYFGNIASADFVNSTAVLGALKNTTGFNTTAVYPVWYKFIRNGKVLLVPSVSFGDVTWTNLYNAGAVYGTDDNGPVGSPGNVNQRTILEFNGDLFLVRAAKGMPDGVAWDGTNIAFNTDPRVQGIYSEYEDLFYPFTKLTPLRQRMVNVASLDAGGVLISGPSATRQNIGVGCQEINGANSLRRGAGSYGNAAQTRLLMEEVGGVAKTAANVWWPVLEYVGRVSELSVG